MNRDVLVGQFPQRKPGQVYVDWTGGALPPVSLIDAHAAFLRDTLIGNPHSHHGPSVRAMEEVQRARAAVLEYVNADPNEYDVIFTAGATAAIRLLEHFKFEGGELLMTADQHNSVNGLRETAKRTGAIHRYAPITDRLELDEEVLGRMLSYPRSNGNKLFAMPAKSNYAGTMHSLNWVTIAQSKGWYVLLDAAAYMANDRLDLSQVKPDFIPISFYKLFGFPTGIGCLIIRRRAYEVMHKKHFAGGSILLVSVMQDFYAPETLGYARYEDGSVNFGMIPTITEGLAFMKSLGETKTHAVGLATQLYDELRDMRANGSSIVIHSARGNDTVTFSVKQREEIRDAWLFEQAANAASIYVRTGCFCNPGVNETVFGYTVDDYQRMYNDAIRPDAITLETLRAHSGGKAIGGIRASFGYANTDDDVQRFTAFTRQYLASI